MQSYFNFIFIYLFICYIFIWTLLPAFFYLNSYAFALRDYHRCFSSRLGPSNGKPQRALTLSLAPSWVGSWPAHLWSISGPIITLLFLASGTLPPSMHRVSGTLPLPILVISSVGTGGFHWRFMKGILFSLILILLDSSCYYVYITLIIIFS